MSLISIRNMGLKRELPLELLYNVVDICAQSGSFNDLKALSLVSRALNRQARKHIWAFVKLPMEKAVGLDKEGKDFLYLVDALSTLPDITSYTKSLHIASYPPEVLIPFLDNLEFRALRGLSITGYNPRAHYAPSSTSLVELMNTNRNIHTLKLRNFRMNPIAFFDLLSQAGLHNLRHCTLDIINTTIDDGWDDYLTHPSPDVVEGFLNKRRTSETSNVARPSLKSLSLTRITNLPNPAFCNALFRDTHSLFDLSSLQRLTITISSYPPVPLQFYEEVIELCCLSVTSLIIHNWQDVTRSESVLVTKFINVKDVIINVYDWVCLGTSVELALQQLSALKSLKKVKFTLESYGSRLEFLPKIKRALVQFCREVTITEEIVLIFKTLSAESSNNENVLIWDKEKCMLSPKS
ncbi:hypothetical protein C8R42DRAFT_637482 [Lentinula raphanica]|nr:hypothetical protein C8R42DRAFT_637482 [Lentinula raphanica]